VELAQAWEAELWLARVVVELLPSSSPYRRYQMLPFSNAAEKKGALVYLDEIARRQPIAVHTRVLLGAVVDSLVQAVSGWGITDIVMATHGRTGLSRVILGSVADALIHRLYCPVILVPPRVLDLRQPQQTEDANKQVAAAHA
jgi:universal stress protein A